MKMKKTLTQCSILSLLAFCSAPPAIAMLNEPLTDTLNRRASSPNTSAAFDFQEEKVDLSNPQDLEKALNTPHIRKLTARCDRALTEEEAREIGTLLSTSQSLKTLELHLHGLTLTGTTYHIAKSLRTNTTLENLTVSSIAPVVTSLGDEGAIIIAEALEKNPKTALRKLTFSLNDINKDGAAALGKLFESTTTLQEVNISGNNIDKEGARALGNGLAKNKTIQSLNLTNNPIGPDGLCSIMTALTNNQEIPIHTLNLSGIQFDEESTRATAIFLATSKTLRELSLCNTGITNTMAEVIGHGIGLNSSLEKLGLSSNALSVEGVLSLLTAFNTHTSVKEIDLTDNRFEMYDLSVGLTDQINSRIESKDLILIF